MTHRYPGLTPPNYFGPSEGFEFLLTQFFDSDTYGMVVGSGLE